MRKTNQKTGFPVVISASQRTRRIEGRKSVSLHAILLQKFDSYSALIRSSNLPSDNNGNIALFKNARQSSTNSIYAAARAVNGDRATYYTQGSCSITNNELNPWWMVDLGSAKTVAVLRLTSRILKDSLKDFDIRVGDNCYDPTGAQL